MTNWDDNAGHLDEGKLLRLLDGELPAAEVAEAQSHLEACWVCRLRQERLQETIFAFVEYRALVTRHAETTAQTTDDLQLSDGSRALRRRLNELQQASPQPTTFARFRNFLSEQFTLFTVSHVRLATVITILLLGIVFALFRADRHLPGVSAHEAVRQALQAQTANLQRTPTPVTYQKLRMRRASQPENSQTLLWEIWYDNEKGRIRQSLLQPDGAVTTVPAGWRAWREFYEKHGWDWRQPLAPQTWLTLLQAAEHTTINRIEWQGESAYVIHARSTAQSWETRLTLRASDWHPLEQWLQLGTADGAEQFELAEQSFAVVSLMSLGTGFFNDVAPRLTVKASPSPSLSPATSPTNTIPAAGPTLPSPSPLPGASALAEAELNLRTTLHQIKADLDDEVTITARPEAIAVRIVTSDENRRRLLQESVQKIPLVNAQVMTRQEAARNATPANIPTNPKTSASDDPPETPVSIIIDEQSAQFPLQAALTRHFQRETASRAQASERAVAFANRMIAFSSDALAEAWSLRRLAERYPADEYAAMDETAREKLDGLRQANVARLRQRFQSADAWLAPLLGNLSGTRCTGASADADNTWQQNALRLFQQCQELDRLTSRLMSGRRQAGSASFNETTEAAALCRAFAQIEARLKLMNP